MLSRGWIITEQECSVKPGQENLSFITTRESEGTWKFCRGRSILQKTCFMTRGVTLLTGLCGVNHIFQRYAERKIGNGAKILFWEHNWVNEAAIAPQFPRLYNITFTK